MHWEPLQTIHTPSTATYYTIHVTKDGKIAGMLSVNGYDGTVWYHNWHGAYIRSLELHEE